MASGVLAQFERIRERVGKRVFEGAKVAWLKTRYANTKAEMEVFSNEMKKRIAKGIINDKVPGVTFGNGEFWRKLASVITVQNAAYGQAKGKRNFYFEVAVGPGKMPGNKVWNGATVWQVAWQKQIGGNVQKPKNGAKGIPIPTKRNRDKRAGTMSGLRFVPRKNKIHGIIGYLVKDSGGNDLAKVNAQRESSGNKKSLSLSTLRSREPAMFIVYESYRHKASPDPWVPSETVIEGHRKAAVRKAFPPRGIVRRVS